MELSAAQNIAVEICEKLQPFCKIIKIAGSVKRKKPTVGDLEIVCVSKTVSLTVDLFGEEKEEVRIKEFVDVVKSLGDIIQGDPATGRYVKIELPQELLQLDLFLPQEYDYYRIYSMRVGSSNYSHNVIAVGWKRLGWVGTENGLRKATDCEETKDEKTGKSKWKCINHNPELPPIWSSEEDFFKWLNVPYIPPEQRNL